MPSPLPLNLCAETSFIFTPLSTAHFVNSSCISIFWYDQSSVMIHFDWSRKHCIKIGKPGLHSERSGPQVSAPSACRFGSGLTFYLSHPKLQTWKMALFLRENALRSGLPRELLAACAISLNSRAFSVLNRPPPNYPGHVPLTRIERAGLAVGSAIGSFMDPYRGGKSSFIWNSN